MLTCLDDEDLDKLDPAVRAAIAKLITAKAPPLPHDTRQPERGDIGQVDGWYPLSFSMTPGFVDGVSQKSKSILRIFAEHQGRVKWSEIAAKTDYVHWQEFRGFLAGMNRRLRSMVDDPKAVLVGWDSSEDEYDDQEEWVDGYVKMHSETARSLRRYFGLE